MGIWTSSLERVIKKTILITGGLGCLGGRLGQYFLNKGFRVKISSSRRNAKLPDELKSCLLVYADFDKVNSLASACLGVDFVVHLATVNSKQSQDNPELAIKVNGVGTYNLIQACVKSKVKYFLYFSTAHVYKSPLIGEINEEKLPRPEHPYSITHRLAEDFLLESIGRKNIKGGIIRLSNSIGLPLTKENSCWTLFVNDVCKQAIFNKSIVITSNPDSERDFISIDSVCKVSEYFLSNQLDADYPVFNVGSGTSYSLLQMARMIADRCDKLFGFHPKISFLKDDSNLKKIQKFKYGIDKITLEMGYAINNDLTSSIDEVLNFCHTMHGNK